MEGGREGGGEKEGGGEAGKAKIGNEAPPATAPTSSRCWLRTPDLTRACVARMIGLSNTESDDACRRLGYAAAESDADTEVSRSSGVQREKDLSQTQGIHRQRDMRRLGRASTRTTGRRAPSFTSAQTPSHLAHQGCLVDYKVSRLKSKLTATTS